MNERSRNVRTRHPITSPRPRAADPAHARRSARPSARAGPARRASSVRPSFSSASATSRVRLGQVGRAERERRLELERAPPRHRPSPAAGRRAARGCRHRTDRGRRSRAARSPRRRWPWRRAASAASRRAATMFVWSYVEQLAQPAGARLAGSRLLDDARRAARAGCRRPSAVGASAAARSSGAARAVEIARSNQRPAERRSGSESCRAPSAARARRPVEVVGRDLRGGSRHRVAQRAVALLDERRERRVDVVHALAERLRERLLVLRAVRVGQEQRAQRRRRR